MQWIYAHRRRVQALYIASAVTLAAVVHVAITGDVSALGF